MRRRDTRAVQDRGREPAAAGEFDEQPAEQQADRQAADIAEKELGDRPVEIGKADHGAAQGEADDGPASPAESRARRTSKAPR